MTDRPKYSGKIRFFVSPSHFKSVSIRDQYAKLMTEVFGLNPGTWKLRAQDHVNGFWVTCHAHQFALFIVLRNNMEYCTNVIKELKPELLFRSKDVYDHVAAIAQVDRDIAKKVMLAAAYHPYIAPSDEFDVTVTEEYST